MQQVIFSTDRKILKDLYDELHLGEICGANFVLLDNETPIGVCRLKIADKVSFDEFKIKKEFDNFACQDFFFRTMLFKLSLNDYQVFIPSSDKRLLQFGFVPCDSGMEIFSKNIVFPHCCG